MIIAQFSEEQTVVRMAEEQLCFVTESGNYHFTVKVGGQPVHGTAKVFMKFDRSLCKAVPRVSKWWHTENNMTPLGTWGRDMRIRKAQ